MNTRLTGWAVVLISVLLVSAQSYAADKTGVNSVEQDSQAASAQASQAKPADQSKSSARVKVSTKTAAATKSKHGSALTDKSGIVVTTEEHSVFKGLLYEVWSRLRALSPKPNNAPAHAVVTAGIRGADVATSLIHPYWKDDRTQDPEYIKELAEYTHARRIAENGDLKGAIKAFSNFIDAHGKSELKPDAQFALGLSYAGAGDKKKSVSTLKAFMKQYPKHPLVADAQQVIDQFNK